MEKLIAKHEDQVELVVLDVVLGSINLNNVAAMNLQKNGYPYFYIVDSNADEFRDFSNGLEVSNEIK